MHDVISTNLTILPEKITDELKKNIQDIRTITYSINGIPFSGQINSLSLTFEMNEMGCYPKLEISYILDNFCECVFKVFSGSVIVRTDYGNFPLEYSLWSTT